MQYYYTNNQIIPLILRKIMIPDANFDLSELFPQYVENT